MRWAAILVFLLAAGSDGLDGYIARHYRQATKLGAVLDAIADKGLLMAGLLTLTLCNWGYRLPWQFTALVISRDMMVVIGSLVLYHLNGDVQVRPRWTGKIATCFQILAVSWVMLQIHFFSPLGRGAAGVGVHAAVVGRLRDGTASASSASPAAGGPPRRPWRLHPWNSRSDERGSRQTGRRHRGSSKRGQVGVVQPDGGPARLPSSTISRALPATVSLPNADRPRVSPSRLSIREGSAPTSTGIFSARVQMETQIALAAAGVILFVVDGRAGLTPVDMTLARQLRRSDKPVLLVVNKIDEEMHTPLEAEFSRLGFAEVYGVSAAHGRGSRRVDDGGGAATGRDPRSGTRGGRNGSAARAAPHARGSPERGQELADQRDPRRGAHHRQRGFRHDARRGRRAVPIRRPGLRADRHRREYATAASGTIRRRSSA